MKKYISPIVISNADLAEGVFLASGSQSSSISCGSKYMMGIYQHPDYSTWEPGEHRAYRKQFGCLGCPAFTEMGCGLLSHYIDSDKALSYDIDNGKRMPSWERKGYDENDPVTDWAM